jgi:hypothetical protein
MYTTFRDLNHLPSSGEWFALYSEVCFAFRGIRNKTKKKEFISYSLYVRLSVQMYQLENRDMKTRLLFHMRREHNFT